MAVTEMMSVSEFGMQYQKMRVDAATINIANANVVQPADGSGFRPLTVNVRDQFGDLLTDKNALVMSEVANDERLVFQPAHPSADSQGFVHYAGVDMAAQMVSLTQATRAYEANIKAFNAQMSMGMKAMEIGK
jgi:flagellar basal-body rod protein FlgC